MDREARRRGRPVPRHRPGAAL